VTAGTGFEVGLTRDGLREDGSTIFGDIGLQRLDDAGITWRMLPPLADPVDPMLLDGLDAILAFGHLQFDQAIVERLPRLSLLARFGAGFDGIDLDGLARAGVVVTNTPVAVRKPMALATLTMILALAHRLLDNHRTVAAGDWAVGRGTSRGAGVQGRTLGIVGLGGIGAELAVLAQAIGFTVVASDHPGSRGRAAELGVRSLSLLELAAASDYVSVLAPLTPETHHLIGDEFLGAMKPSAYLVNTSRGELVDPESLRGALASGRIAGAGLDVFEPEPPSADDQLLAMDSVLLSPHCLAWTADFTEAVSASVMESIIDAANCRRPKNTLNPGVYDVGWRRERVQGERS
jgi:phosphoglycerate dehydrogenase-like enzyme